MIRRIAIALLLTFACLAQNKDNTERITLEGDHLAAQLTNQSKNPIFAESDTMFFFKIVDAQIEFVKNEKGEVTNLVLHQGRRDVKGVRK